MQHDPVSEPATIQSQDAIVAAMQDPAFYPDSPPKIAHIQTHISHLFFAGELVFKIKKAVRFSFLDYSTLERRRYFLDQELILNRRLTGSVYLEVVPVTASGVAWERELPGSVLEYALVMKRLPEARMMPVLLGQNAVTAEMICDLAEVLAAFHKDAPRVFPADPTQHPSATLRQWQENLADFRSLPNLPVSPATLDELESFGSRFIENHRDQLISRAAQGWIRDGHGDLHCEHICFAPERIQIFDCLEFSSDLRVCDIACEIAFLTMDLKARGADDLARSFISEYRARLVDPELLDLLPFYECYRALVRAKVHVLRSGPTDPVAARYFGLAKRHMNGTPFLLIVCGLTGSGKSFLARRLGERLKMPVINSDVVRKRIAGTAGEQKVPFGTGVYDDRMTEQTYAEMADEARRCLQTGRGAILDATFRLRKQRKTVIRLAAEEGVAIFVIHCFADADVIKKRLETRALEGRSISDGRWEIYLQQAIEEEAIDEVPAAVRLELNTNAPLDTLTDRVKRFLALAGAKPSH